MDLIRRLRIGLTLAALGLVVLTGWRAWSVASAPPAEDATAQSLPVSSVGGGVLLQWAQGRVTLNGAALHPGHERTVGDVTLRLSARTEAERPILRRPWTTYAHPNKGFRRIDFGPDPLGRADGVRDRVLLPDGGFHLVADHPGRDPRFLPADRSAVLVAESALTVQFAGSSVALEPGQRARVGADFVVRLPSSALRVRWVDGPRTAAVMRGGKAVGYRSEVAPEFVVARLAPIAAPQLTVTAHDAGGAELAAWTPADGALLLHGTGDRLGPLARGVLPARAADLQLEGAIAEGLADGWIEVGGEASQVQMPSDRRGRSPRADLGWTVARSLVSLMADYDRARLPTAIRFVSGVHPASAACSSGGAPQPMRWDEALAAWVPSVHSGVTTCTFVAREAVIEVAVPAAWRSGGQWTSLPATAGLWSRYELGDGSIELRLDARPLETQPDAVSAVMAGGPAGTFLETSALSSRAFGGWDALGGDGAEAASAVWTELPGDRWRCSGVAPPAKAQAAQPVFLRVPVQARSGGLIALDVQVPGVVQSVQWNGAPLEVGVIDRSRAGVSRLSLRTQRGANLLAVHTLRPATAPALAAGGAAFEADADGNLQGLSARVADRRARRAVAAPPAEHASRAHAGGDAVSLLVERGDGALRAGDRLPLAAGRGLPGELAVAVRAGELLLRVDAAGLVQIAAPTGTLWSPSGDPTDLPLHPVGSAPLWTHWSPGARLSIGGSPLRLLLPPPEPTYRTAVPPSLARGRTLTLDDDLQSHAQAALDAHLAALPRPAVPDTHPLRGSVFAMDAVTGAILACVGRTADGSPAPGSCWQDTDLRPGSAFKPVVALAALSSADPTVQRMLRGDLPAGLRRAALSGSLTDARLPPLPLGSQPDLALRTRLRNFRGAPSAVDRTLSGALRSSDNVWFGYLGLLLHEPLREGWLETAVAEDARRERAWPVHTVAHAAGFDRPVDLGFGLRGAAGRVPALSPDSDAAVAASAVGQDGVRATPLGIATVFAALATDGSAPAPTLDPSRPAARSRLASPGSAERVREGLLEVIRVGTARSAFADNPHRASILGKTGSSQRIDAQGVPRTDSWFAGAVVPDGGAHPIVIVAVLPGAGLGGAHAAEVVDAFSRALIAASGGPGT